MATGKQKKSTVTTLTREKSREELTHQEEMVVRMTRGISETDGHPLEFQGSDIDETRAKLALMEAQLLAQMHQSGPLAEQSTGVDLQVKSAILNHLGSLEE